MKTVELKATHRDLVGKSAAKKIRHAKRIPAVVYGHKTKPASIEIDYKEFEHVIHSRAGGNVIINLKVAGTSPLEKTVIVKQIQHHPVNESIEHVDFNVISLTEKIKVHVPLVVKGDSAGVKDGGVLDIVRHDVEVECLPTQIPEKLEVDVTLLKIGDAIHIKEIKMPEGVKCLLDPDEVAVAVHAIKIEEEKPAEEGATKEPEVIAKGKVEEGAEGEVKAKEAPKAEEKSEKAPKS